MAAETVSLAKWYFESDGERKGPYSEAEMAAFIKNGSLGRDSSVWRSGTPEWTGLDASDLKKYLPIDEPPPLTGQRVGNGIVWVLAFAPILGAMLQAFLAGLATGGDQNPLVFAHYFEKLWFVPLLLNAFLSLLDARKLEKAGHGGKKLTFWALFLVPVYLYQRAKLLKQNLSYFIVWLICFGLILLS